MEEKKDDLLKAKSSGKRIEQSAPDAEFQTTPAGRKVYDPGEPIVAKMNRERAVFDKDLFFQELFENYLVAVERHEPRQLPDSRVITYWDLHTTFEDFMSDSLKFIDKRIEAIKFAKAVGSTKLSAIGDSVLNEKTFKADPNSNVVGKKVDSEEQDALYEILRKAKETIEDYNSGRITLIVNTKTGRVRVGNSTAIKN